MVSMYAHAPSTFVHRPQSEQSINGCIPELKGSQSDQNIVDFIVVLLNDQKNDEHVTVYIYIYNIDIMFPTGA